jgi:hypothetical protein
MTVKLLKYSGKHADLFYTPEIIEKNELYSEERLKDTCLRTVENYIEKNPDYNKIVEAYAKKNNLERIAILTANGGNIGNTWCYFNYKTATPIQSWINEMDGNYKVLILDLCNPQVSTIKSKKSIVLHPNSNVSNKLLTKQEVNIDLFLPGSGYFDSYFLEEELEKLRE